MIWLKNNILYRLFNDKLLTVWLWFSSILVSLIVCLIIVFLFYESLPLLWEGGILRFFTDSDWFPIDNLMNIVPMLMGSLLIMLGAILLATPLGIISAVFCRFYAPSFIAVPFSRLIELLGGIPSVVYGFWGLVTLVPIIQKIRPPGTSLLAGVLVLALMILPTITLIIDATFVHIPESYLKGALGLGLSRFSIIKKIIFPYSKSGIFTAIILGSGRAIGETMAILMICGNIIQIPTNVYQPMRTLTSNIALEMAYAMDSHRAALFVSGLLLTGIIIVFVLLAHHFNRRYRIA